MQGEASSLGDLWALLLCTLAAPEALSTRPYQPWTVQTVSLTVFSQQHPFEASPPSYLPLNSGTPSPRPQRHGLS